MNFKNEILLITMKLVFTFNKVGVVFI